MRKVCREFEQDERKGEHFKLAVLANDKREMDEEKDKGKKRVEAMAIPLHLSVSKHSCMGARVEIK